MHSSLPKLLRSTTELDLAWMDARMSKYPINLFSAYGVRCNTLDDMSEWLMRASEGMPESACQLGLAYLEGNGAPVDRQQAKHWLNKGATNGHLFCRYKLAELAYREAIADESALTLKHIEAVQTILNCAKAGIGEACISLHHILKHQGEALATLGWDLRLAQQVDRHFQQALKLAYQYRPGDSHDHLLKSLSLLGELGSGHAYYCAGRFLEELRERELAFDYFEKGAKLTLHSPCLGKALDLARGATAEALLAWAEKHLPNAEMLRHRTHKSYMLTLQSYGQVIEGSATSLNQQSLSETVDHAAATIAKQLVEEDFTGANDMAIFLKDISTAFAIPAPQKPKVERVLRELRRVHPIADTSLLSHYCLTKVREEQSNSIDAKRRALGHPPIAGSSDSFGLTAVDANAGMTASAEKLAELEFLTINEHAYLLRGVARGMPSACEYSAYWTLSQLTRPMPRVVVAGIFEALHPIVSFTYAYAKTFDLLVGHDASQLKVKTEKYVPPSIKLSLDQAIETEAGRLKAASTRELLFRMFGRGCRYSQRLISDILSNNKKSSGSRQPLHAAINPAPAADKVADLWGDPLLSTCPIHRKWALEQSGDDSDDAGTIAEFIKAGDYPSARRHYADSMMLCMSKTHGRFDFSVSRGADEHELLSIMAREMIFRGDHHSAEPIIDYLIYARAKIPEPWGLLHHVSAWVKYQQGKLSDAITMLEDCTPAIECNSISGSSTNVDVLEFRIFHIELLLRAQRLREAKHYLTILRQMCTAEALRDRRIDKLEVTLKQISQSLHNQYLSSEEGSDIHPLSRTSFDPDINVPTYVVFGPSVAEDIQWASTAGQTFCGEFERIPLSNMDRYRGACI
jgi:tetratricopeptide (TPR) repeat protein